MKDSIPPLVKGHSVAGNSSSSDFADVKAKFLDAKKKGKTNRDIFNQLAATNDSLLADATETGMPWQSLGGEHSESYDSSSGSTTMQLGKSGSMLQQRQQQQQQQRESADSLSGNSRPRLKTFDVLYQTDNNIMVPAEVACPRRVSELGTSQARHRHHRRNQIFAQGLTAGDLRRISQLPAMTAVDHSKEVFQIKNLAAIMGVLGRFFLPNDTQTENFGEADHILAQFEKEVVEQGEWLMREGEEGYKMYIITEGSLKVFIDDKNVRALGPGDAVGELALLYSAPRSASVQAAECSTLWSLTRDKFRSVQAFAGSANVMQRCNMLSDIIELDVLDKYSLSKLASVMEPVDLSAGEVLFTEGQLVDRCILIERGQLEATQTGPPRLSNVDLDKVVGASHTKNKAAPQRSQDVPVCYGSGLLLGIPAMLCVGGGVRGVWDPPESSGGKVNPKGAICPVTLTATSGTRIGIFTIAQFEDTVGPISEVFSMRLRGRPSLRKLMRCAMRVLPIVAPRLLNFDYSAAQYEPRAQSS
jgi:CRP-like cAMP-binding protein